MCLLVGEGCVGVIGDCQGVGFCDVWGYGGSNDDSSGFNDGCGDVVEGCVYKCVGVEVGFGFGVGVGGGGGGGLSNSVGGGCGWCCWVGLAVGNTASAAPVSLSEILD